MPALVAAERLHDVVVGLGVHACRLADVRDRRRLELELAEAPGELVLLVDREELAREDQQRVLEPRGVELAHVASSRSASSMPRTIAPNVASSGSISMALTPTVEAYHGQPTPGAGAIRASRRPTAGAPRRGRGLDERPAYCSLRPLVVPMNRRRVTSIASPRCAGWFCIFRNLRAPLPRRSPVRPVRTQRTDELVFEVLVALEEPERSRSSLPSARWKTRCSPAS